MKNSASLGEELEGMFQSFSDNILKEVEATKDEMHTKALAIEVVGFPSKILFTYLFQIKLLLPLRQILDTVTETFFEFHVFHEISLFVLFLCLFSLFPNYSHLSPGYEEHAQGND